MKRFATPLLALLVLGCGEVPTETSADLPSFAISDGMTGGNEHFFFLPPLVPAPAYSGVFDATLGPVVTITADGEVDIVLDAVLSETDEHYQTNWHTDQYELDPSKEYRIGVSVGELELGSAEVLVAASGSELKSLRTDEFVTLKDGRTLPIKFRIEVGALSAFPDEGLLAWYPFNGTPEDESGNDRDLTNQGGTYLEDRFGVAASSAAFATLAAQMTTEWPTFPLDAFTVSLWYRIDRPYEYNTFAFFEYGRPQAGPWGAGLLFAIDENWPARSCAPGSGYGVGIVIANDGFGPDDGCLPFSAVSTWSHLVVTAAGGTAEVYVNGSHRGSFSYTSPVPTTNQTLWIGNKANFQTGLTTRLVDDVGVWNRVLGAEEILQLFELDASGGP